MIPVVAVVLFMASVVSSEDLDDQVTPRHFGCPKNLVSKDISVVPRLPNHGVLSPGSPGGTVHELATVVTREGASRLFVNQGSTNLEIEEKFRKSTALDNQRNKIKGNEL